MLKRVNRRYHDVVTGATAAAEAAARAARRPLRESWGCRLRNLTEDAIDDFQVGLMLSDCAFRLVFVGKRWVGCLRMHAAGEEGIYRGNTGRGWTPSR